MFGLFKSAPFLDPGLGELHWRRGFWRGEIALDQGGTVSLAVSGTRKAPDAAALQAARSLASQFPAMRPVIEAALFEHYTPYAEVVADDEAVSDETMPILGSASEVWSHVALAHVSVSPLSGMLAIELGYNAAWDQEHTLGARFQGDKLLELCGSVLSP